MWFVSLILATAFAASKPASSATNLNLIDESNRLQVLKEETVQQEIATARRTYGIGYSDISAKKILVLANDRIMSYDDVRRPGIAGRLGYFPLAYHGFLGLVGNVNYNYGEKTAQVKTALHWFVADLSLAYRYEYSSNAYLKPSLAVGAGYNVLVQRGPSYYNTSEARDVTIATLGLNLNLNRALGIASPLLWELSGQYRRVFDSADNNYNFNGEHFALGLELAL